MTQGGENDAASAGKPCNPTRTSPCFRVPTAGRPAGLRGASCAGPNPGASAACATGKGVHRPLRHSAYHASRCLQDEGQRLATASVAHHSHNTMSVGDVRRVWLPSPITPPVPHNETHDEKCRRDHNQSAAKKRPRPRKDLIDRPWLVKP